jgi:predicted adenine nucleotide alpha hydrolase (AANH) superfamily ATPase
MNKTNYFLLQKNILKEVEKLNSKPKLLLHSCCAPCSTFCLEKVTPYFETSVFYYNPNITIESEYFKRLNEQINFVNLVYLGSVNVIAGEYRIEDFLTKIKGLENEKEGGSRCKICYYLRLEETCKKAKELGYDYFSTTLSISPHKNATWLNEIGEELSNKYGVKYLYADFKKEGGYLRSIELSKLYNLYRQDFCGCEFSKK